MFPKAFFFCFDCSAIDIVIRLISGSPCFDDGAPWKDASKGEIHHCTPTVFH